MDKRALAEFLRARRERVRPEDVGLLRGSRRRTPGLRREEVAQLAHISVDHYSRLGQARGRHPSRQVLDGIARALRLCDLERAHLFELAGERERNRVDGPSREVAPGTLNLLDRLTDAPAFVVDDTCRALLRIEHHARERFAHSGVGEVELDFDILTAPGQDRQLIIFTAEPGSRADEALRLLKAVGTRRVGVRG